MQKIRVSPHFLHFSPSFFELSAETVAYWLFEIRILVRIRRRAATEKA
jgi:hypothetical protein